MWSAGTSALVPLKGTAATKFLAQTQSALGSVNYVGSTCQVRQSCSQDRTRSTSTTYWLGLSSWHVYLQWVSAIRCCPFSLHLHLVFLNFWHFSRLNKGMEQFFFSWGTNGSPEFVWNHLGNPIVWTQRYILVEVSTDLAYLYQIYVAEL